MQKIFETIKEVALQIDQLIVNEDTGYVDETNATGDQQLKLDVACDLLIEKAFRDNPEICALISEEKEEAMYCQQAGKFTLCYDPLDGSSIVDANLAVGSIFAIYDGEPSGESLMGAAYVVFGPRIEIVTVVRGERPIRYRYINGAYQVFHPIELKERGKLNASGGSQKHWQPRHMEFIHGLFADGYRLRYSGGMVPDLHQILVKGGGLFSYPSTADNPNGKLRVLFEVLPFALIFESVGGEAIDEKGRRLLELTVTHPHARTPCFFGSRYEIQKLKEAYGVA